MRDNQQIRHDIDVDLKSRVLLNHILDACGRTLFEIGQFVGGRIGQLGQIGVLWHFEDLQQLNDCLGIVDDVQWPGIDSNALIAFL